MEAVYILGGPEQGRRNDYIDQIKKDFTKKWKEAPLEHKLYAQESPVSELMDLLLNGSLFSKGKLVLYFAADQIKAKPDIQALLNYIKKPAEATVLILISDSFGVDKAIESAIPKEAKIIFWELSAKEMENWVIIFFKNSNISIDKSAVSSLIELVDSNTEAMKKECSRLSLFYPSGSIINEEAIERYIVHNRAEDVFSLFDKMALSSFEQALSCLSAILANRDSSAIAVISGLIWSFRRLNAVQKAIVKGTSFEQAARAERITRRATLNAYNSAQHRWPIEICETLIAFGIDMDARMRSMGQAHEQTLLELFIYACMIKKNTVDLGLF